MERAKLLAVRGQWDKTVEEREFVLRNGGEDEELLRSAHALHFAGSADVSSARSRSNLKGFRYCPTLRLDLLQK